MTPVQCVALTRSELLAHSEYTPDQTEGPQRSRLQLLVPRSGQHVDFRLYHAVHVACVRGYAGFDAWLSCGWHLLWSMLWRQHSVTST
jgi:hypothetical protein